MSLAAAFEIGRLLGLSQPALVRALIQWRAEQFGAARANQLGSVLTDAGAAARRGAPRRRPRPARRDGAVDAGAGADPRQVVGPARPIADPGRPIELDGPLDQRRGRRPRHRPRRRDRSRPPSRRHVRRARGDRGHHRPHRRRPRPRPRSTACGRALDTELGRDGRRRDADDEGRPGTQGRPAPPRTGAGTGGRPRRARRAARRVADRRRRRPHDEDVVHERARRRCSSSSTRVQGRVHRAT